MMNLWKMIDFSFLETPGGGRDVTEGLRPKNQQKTTFQVIQILSTRGRTFTLKCIRELQIGVTIYPPEWLKLTIKDSQCQVDKNVGLWVFKYTAAGSCSALSKKVEQMA